MGMVMGAKEVIVVVDIISGIIGGTRKSQL